MYKILKRMYKNTIQEIIFFIVTLVLILETGKLVLGLHGIVTFNDFASVIIFLISFLFFINYLIKVSNLFLKLLNSNH